ncbi:MAG TPA: PAS domain S-box protein, partial [Methanocella sp.]
GIDITVRKRAEDALRKNERFLNNVLDSITDGISVLDRDMTIISVNRTMENWHPDTLPLAGKKCYSAYHGRSEPCVWCPSIKAMQEKTSQIDIVPRDVGGRIVGWQEVHSYPMQDDAGQVVGVIDYVRDITERKLAEDALRESEEKFRVLAEASRTMIWLYQGDRFVYVNSAGERLTGYTIDDLLQMKFWEVVHPGDRELVKARGLARQRGEAVPGKYEVRLLTRGGETRWAELTAGRILYRGEPAGIATFFDITERKRAEGAQREGEERLQLCCATARLGIFDWDLINDRHVWSPETYEIYGLPPETHLTCKLITDLIYPGDRLDSVLKAGLDPAGMGEYTMEYRIRRASDGAVRWVYLMTRVFFEGEGKARRAARVLGAIQDITERKLAEGELAEAKATAELYLDLMGHDINNMNQVTMGYIEVAYNKAVSEGKLASADFYFLEKALKSVHNSSNLIKNVQMLQWARLGKYEPEVLDLGEVLKEVIVQHGNVPDRDVVIRCDMDNGSFVEANWLLKDVFINLLGNAIKHSDGPLDINILLSKESLDSRAYWKVVVEDNGPGIPDSQKTTLFDRLSLSASRARGKGFGLCLIKLLVDGYRGEFWVEDRVAGDHTQGARFVVLLPAVTPGKP